MKNKIGYKLLRTLSPVISDELYLKLKWRVKNGGTLNIKKPKSFNEKLNWLKIYDRNPLYTTMADKYKVKEFVVKRSDGDVLTAKCFGVWDSIEDVDFEKLPQRFVLKCTHDSGSMVLCDDKSKLNLNKVKKDLSQKQKRNFYLFSREWPYKNIERKIIAEEYLGDTEPLRDYKFWCFNGIPQFMYITNKVGKIYENFYDMDFNPVNIDHGFPRYKPEFDKPAQFEKMKELAGRLSKDVPFVRVDFWIIHDKIYFGEYTFYDWGGFQPFSDYKQDIELGDLIILPKGKNEGE